MVSLSEKLAEAQAILLANDIPEARREASLLVSLALKRERAFLIAHPEYVLSSSEAAIVDQLVHRRSLREPFQYIAGVQEFYGLEFLITPDVLIPRPETELLVERVLTIFKRGPVSVCDVGIGSGCIAVSILHSLPLANAAGLDISVEALRVAQRNARKHGVEDRLRLIESDVFTGLENETFDVIVSNPPYVPLQDIDLLQAEVRDHEPHLALTDGSTGLTIIERIVKEAPDHLVSGGYLLIEIGFLQRDQVLAMFDPMIWRSRESVPDLQGIPRMAAARLN